MTNTFVVPQAPTLNIQVYDVTLGKQIKKLLFFNLKPEDLSLELGRIRLLERSYERFPEIGLFETFHITKYEFHKVLVESNKQKNPEMFCQK